jgi:hypothetical protein
MLDDMSDAAHFAAACKPQNLGVLRPPFLDRAPKANEAGADIQEHFFKRSASIQRRNIFL